MMRCCCAIGRTFAEPPKNLLQLPGSGNDDTYLNGPQFEEKPKIIEISIKERVLIVPLHFQCYAAFQAIDRVGGTVKSLLVNQNGGSKSFLLPALCIKRFVNPAAGRDGCRQQDRGQCCAGQRQ